MTSHFTRRLAPLAVTLFISIAAVALHAADDPKAANPQEQPATDTTKVPEKPDAEYLAELRAAIAGREQEPAEKVFHDIQVFKGMPAERVLRIMEMGYGPALGVRCSFCHKPGKWEESTEHRAIARDMAGMTRDLNAKLKEIAGQKAVVNCYTCHRGSGTPATSAAAPAAKQ